MINAHGRLSMFGDLLSSVRGVIFFGVPHRGADLASSASFATNLINLLGINTNQSFVTALQRNSKTFMDISEQFIERAARLQIRTFYETEKLYHQLVSGMYAIVQPTMFVTALIITLQIVDR